MNTATRLGVYVLGLVVVFAVAAGIGYLAGPLATAGGSPDSHTPTTGASHAATGVHPDTRIPEGRR